MKNIFFPIITEEETKLPFYLKGLAIQGTQEHILRPQGNIDFQWIHTAKGKGTYAEIRQFFNQIYITKSWL